MAKNQKNIPIPFNKNGDALKVYRLSRWRNQVEHDQEEGITWKKNFEFYASMEYVGIDRGTYSDRMILRDRDTDKTYHVHMPDFIHMMPFFRFGVITGRFTFKRFNHKYGVKFIK